MVFSDWLKPGALPYRVAKRLLQVAFTLFGLLILTFIIGRVMPIDPVLAIVGQDADQSTYQQVYQQLGLDKPLYVQFGIYFNSLLHGDLGNAMLTGRPVVDDIIRVFPATVELATMAIIVGAGLGVPLGVVAGYYGGIVDTILMRITDIFISFPSLVLALAFVAALGTGLEHVVIAITLTAWPPIARLARLARAETLSLRQADFVSAVKLQGASSLRILVHHIVPLCLPSVIIRITMNMAGIILTAAGLGFLGLGAQPPDPEWGP